MLRVISIIICIFSFQAHGRILFEDGKTKTQTRHNYDKTSEAREVSDFWSQRKMGFGVHAGGATGLIGGAISIHFHPQWSVDLGYGGGSHFQSFGLRVKKLLLMSSPLNPYIGGGFNRWYRNNSRPFNSKDVAPGFVGDKFMSDADRREGRIDESLLHGALGLQYVFTEGSMKGYGFFLEGLIMMDLQELITVPTASVGMNYFF